MASFAHSVPMFIAVGVEATRLENVGYEIGTVTLETNGHHGGVDVVIDCMLADDTDFPLEEHKFQYVWDGSTLHKGADFI